MTRSCTPSWGSTTCGRPSTPRSTAVASPRPTPPAPAPNTAASSSASAAASSTASTSRTPARRRAPRSCAGKTGEAWASDCRLRHQGAAQPQPSLPLDRRRRLARHVICNSRNLRNLINNPIANRLQQLIRQMRPPRRHKVDSLNSPQRNHPRIPPRIAHHPNRLHRQKHRKRLTGLVIPP